MYQKPLCASCTFPEPSAVNATSLGNATQWLAWGLRQWSTMPRERTTKEAANWSWLVTLSFILSLSLNTSKPSGTSQAEIESWKNRCFSRHFSISVTCISVCILCSQGTSPLCQQHQSPHPGTPWTARSVEPLDRHPEGSPQHWVFLEQHQQPHEQIFENEWKDPKWCKATT